MIFDKGNYLVYNYYGIITQLLRLLSYSVTQPSACWFLVSVNVDSFECIFLFISVSCFVRSMGRNRTGKTRFFPCFFLFHHFFVALLTIHYLSLSMLIFCQLIFRMFSFLGILGICIVLMVSALIFLLYATFIYFSFLNILHIQKRQE